MNFHQPRGAIVATWSVVGAFAVIQAIAWASQGVPGDSPGSVLQTAAAWGVILTLAAVSTRRILKFKQAIAAHEQAHIQTLEQVVQLELSNAVLQVVARSVDVPLAFQALAERIVRLVACDRVGLALLSENGEEFQTYTARVNQEERRSRPRPDIIFKAERTAIGSVVKSREPLLIDDTSVDAPDFLDVNVLYSAGLRSALLLPLLTKGRAVGTLNVV